MIKRCVRYAVSNQEIIDAQCKLRKEVRIILSRPGSIPAKAAATKINNLKSKIKETREYLETHECRGGMCEES